MMDWDEMKWVKSLADRITNLEKEVEELRKERDERFVEFIEEDKQRVIDRADAYNRVLKEKYGKKFEHSPEGFYNQYCKKKDNIGYWDDYKR